MFADLVKAEGIRRGAGSRPPVHDPRRRRRLDLEHRQQPSSPRPPRSWTCSTPASTCTTSPASWSSCCWTARTNGSPPAWRTSTTATSTASAGPPALYPLEGIKKDELDTALGYFENNAPRMRYHWFRSARPVRRLRSRRGRLQDGHRAAPQTLRHALDRRRRRRHHHAPLPAGQQARRPDLAPAAQPDVSRLTSRTR